MKDITDKGLLSDTDKEVLEINDKKINSTRSGQNIWIGISEEKIYRYQASLMFYIMS